MNRISKELLLELTHTAKRPVDHPNLERVLNIQEDASLRSPSTEAHYYRFLYRLTQLMQPKVILELGTHTGISAACFADGNPQGHVITVNNHVELKEENRRANIEYRIHDSLKKVEIPGGIDILFIDTEHDGIRPLNEYNLYEKDVNPGGFIFFDDITIGDPMKAFWDRFTPARGEKIELKIHGWVGFGAVLL